MILAVAGALLKSQYKQTGKESPVEKRYGCNGNYQCGHITADFRNQDFPWRLVLKK